MNTLKLIDSFEELLDQASRIPLSGNIVVKEEDVFDLINEIRESFNEEVKKAKQIVKEREAMLEAAQREAHMIIKGVEANIESMINETAIKRRAEQRAQEIEETSTTKAREVMKQAEDYADEVLTSLDKYTNQCLGNIKEAQRQLTSLKTKTSL